MMSEVVDSLKEKGYAVQENVLSEAECDALAESLEAMEDNEAFEDWKKRDDELKTVLQNVHYAMPDEFLDYINHPQVMDVVESVLDDDFTLTSFNASKAKPHNDSITRYHIDSRKPVSQFNQTYQIVGLFCIDEFTEENGGTHVKPYSHKIGESPRNKSLSNDEFVAAEASKGSVLFTLGQTWHGIGDNITDESRWGIVALYSCWWVKPIYDYVQSCTPEIFDKCSEQQKELLGFTSRPPADWTSRVKTNTDVAELPETLKDAQEWDG
jgi:ectoine hydroxylase-related dioxygenase (phytanoyl-CoA dioxygenase family)